MSEGKEQQLFFMRWAIRLGEQGRLSAPPNPWVGCVIVKDGEILGEGFHEAAGQDHAERVALKAAGPLARGATAYISLEPCAHHGQTPPCVDALIEAGIRKVVIPFLDPDPLVAGRGIAALQAAGIEVIIGCAEEEAFDSLEPYFHHRKTGLPFTLLKAAMSLDGRTAAADGSSQWITGEAARHDVHLLRASSQAILVGSQTALVDNPRLTVRGVEVNKQPLRVLIDSQGKVPVQGYLADQTLAPTLVFTSNLEKKEKWDACGAEGIVVQKIELLDILQELGRRGVIQLLVEGGGHLHSAFIKQHLAHRFSLYVGSCLLGDQGTPLLPDLSIPSIQEALKWQLRDVKRFGNDVRLDFLPSNQLRKETRPGS